jgi:hypothetical protein
MSDNAVNESITEPIEDDRNDGTQQQESSFPLAIQELGEGLFLKYPEKTTFLSDENISGIIKANALNEFMQAKYRYRYVSIDAVIEKKLTLSMSRNGYGVEKFIEIVKSVQASFEQMQLPLGIGDRLRR